MADRIFVLPNPLRSIDYKALLKGGTIETRDHDDDLPELCKMLFARDFKSMFIVGSCNGLICLGGYGKFFLWNPHTKEAHQVPEIVTYSRGPAFYGFGFDPTTEDYKIVFGRSKSSPPAETYLAVFSLKLGSWKRYRGLDYVKLTGQGCYLNGALHWMECNRDEMTFHPISETSKVISFELAGEKFGNLGSLSKVISWDCKMYALGVSHANCLFLGTFNRRHEFNIWVMEQYGVENSWTKFLELSSKVLPRALQILPVSISENGEVLMNFAGETLVLYTQEEKTPRVVFRVRAEDPFLLHDPLTHYIETTVSPKTGRGLGGEQTSETNLDGPDGFAAPSPQPPRLQSLIQNEELKPATFISQEESVAK